MKRILYIFFLLSVSLVYGKIPAFIIKGSYAQVDSLLQIASEQPATIAGIIANNQLGAFYESTSNYKEALSHLYAAEKMNTDIAPDEKIFTYNYLGYIYWHKSDYKISLYYHNKALALAKTKGISNSNLAFTYLMLGGDYYDLGDYQRTSEYFFNALQLYEQLGDDVGRVMTHNRLSKLYYKLKDFRSSLDQAAKAQALNKSINYVRETAISFNCLGNVYIETQATDSALFYFKKTLFFFKKSGDVIGQAIASINLGDSYTQLFQTTKEERDLDEAYNYYQMSYMLNSKVDNKFGMIYGVWGVADIDMSRGKSDLALSNYRKALSVARSIDAKNEQYHLFWKMYSVFEQKKQNDSSHAYLKAYVELKNSMENEEQTKALLRQESKYEIAKKIDEKNEEAKRDRLIQEEKNKRKNYFILAVILIMLVLAYAVIMSIKRLRTIQSQNEIIHSINSKLTMQKTEITDSINYARRIQEAILPSESFLKKNFPDCFVLYLPKDIVAGDFYWMENVGGKILFAVADCTGHGVPGALVSVVCSNALNRTVFEFGITEPGKILDKTRELVLEAFSRSDKDVKDGMDISLASVDMNTLEILWAGANNPLWYVSNGRMNEIAANKQPIGQTENPTTFITHRLQLQKGDSIYLFTDGYADQFGGPKGKKFKYKPFMELLLSVQGRSMKEQHEALNKAIEAWRGDLEQVDDILIIGTKF